MTRLAGKATLSALALGLAIFGLTSVPGHVYAQGNDDGGSITDPANKKINLDLESTNLYYGLKLLFSQVKANFTIDESLKSLTVTAHLTDVPFRVALETLLKSTGTPLTYKVENGIYSVVPKVEEAQPQEEPTTPEPEVKSGGYKYGIIHPSNLSAIDIVQAFGGNIVSVGYDSKAYGTGGMGGMGMGGMGMGGMGMGGMGMGGMGMGGLGGGLGGFGGGGYGGYGGGGYGGYGGSNNFGRGGGIGGGYGGGGIGRGF